MSAGNGAAQCSSPAGRQGRLEVQGLAHADLTKSLQLLVRMVVGQRPNSACLHCFSCVNSSCRTLITNLHTLLLGAPFHSALLGPLREHDWRLGSRTQTWGAVMDAGGLKEGLVVN